MAATLGWGLVARQVGTRTARVVAAVVGLTRVSLELHWLSDVVAGWLFGPLALAVAAAVARRLDEPSVRPAVLVGAPGWLVSSRWAWGLPVAAALVPLIPLVLVPGPERMKDLLVYVGAGGAAGAGADVYDVRTALDMPFTYPPFAALLSEPLSRVPLGLLHPRCVRLGVGWRPHPAGRNEGCKGARA